MENVLKKSRKTVDRVVKDYLRPKTHNIQRCHLISAASKAKRRSRAKKIMGEIRSAGEKVFIWSDEKIFTVESKLNSQNEWVLAASSSSIDPAARAINRRQKPAGPIFWAAVGYDTSKSTFWGIFDVLKINTQVYVDFLEENLLPWVNASFADENVFIQGDEPSHTSNVTQRWCKTHLKAF